MRRQNWTAFAIRAQIARIVRAFVQLSATLSIDDDVACVKKLKKLSERKQGQMPMLPVGKALQDADLTDVRESERDGLTRWRAQHGVPEAAIAAASAVESFDVRDVPPIEISPMVIEIDSGVFPSIASRMANGARPFSGLPKQCATNSVSSGPAISSAAMAKAATPFVAPAHSKSWAMNPPRPPEGPNYHEIPVGSSRPQDPEIKVNLRSSRTKMPAFSPDHGLLATGGSNRVPPEGKVHKFAPPSPDQENSHGDGQLSESARREVLRIQLMKRGHIARSLAMANEYDETDLDTCLVNDWNCQGWNALLIKRDELLAKSSADNTETEKSDEQLARSIAEAAKNAAAAKATPISKPNFNTKNNPFRHYSDTALMLLAQNPSTDASALFWMCCHTNQDIRSAVARNPNCPAEALTYLARDHEAGIRHAIAENPKASVGILEMLAADKNPLIAWRAQNSLNLARGRRTVTDLRLPEWQAKKKSATASQEVQSTTGNHCTLPFSEQLSATEETIAFLKLIAHKTNTPARRLAELARHPDWRIRSAVAENANTPLELLWLLAKDGVPEVKLKITENYNCPLDLLETLKEDVDPYVAWQAKSVLNRILCGTQTQPSGEHQVTRPRTVISRELS